MTPSPVIESARKTAPAGNNTRIESTYNSSQPTILGQMVVDCGLVALAYFGSFWLRFHGGLFASGSIYQHQLIWVLPVVAAVTLFINLGCGIYKRRWNQSGPKEICEIAFSVFLVAAFWIAVRSSGLFEVDGQRLSFAVIFLGSALTIVLLSLPRIVASLWVGRQNKVSSAGYSKLSIDGDDLFAAADEEELGSFARQSDAHIIVKDVSLRFRVYRNPSPRLKEALIERAKRKKIDSVTEFEALRDINLELRPGDRLGIVGLNGAGKSTLLKAIVGIYPTQSGEISVQGKVTPLIELGTGFDHELSGRENIYLNGALLGRSYKQMQALEKAIIDFSELEDKIDLPIKYYSTGMHGRLAFSIAAICDCEILLMDEIFAAGDVKFIQKCFARLKEMMDRSQILVLVSHDNQHILELCNKAIVLHKGKLVFAGGSEEAVDYYMDNIVADEKNQTTRSDFEAFEDREIDEDLDGDSDLECQPIVDDSPPVAETRLPRDYDDECEQIVEKIVSLRDRIKELEQDNANLHQERNATAYDYDEDCLRVIGKNVDSLEEPDFLESYDRGMQSGHSLGREAPDDLNIRWRIYTCCWAARHAANIEGDFVECGVGTGVFSLPVCNYVDFSTLRKKFFLFDTFCGIAEDQASNEEERDMIRENNELFYGECYDIAARNFAPYPNAKLIRGRVPDTLSTVKIGKVAYLHLDMNCAFPEYAALNHFWDRLSPGAVVILGDYGWQRYKEQKAALDKFAREHQVQIYTAPTGQGILLKP